MTNRQPTGANAPTGKSCSDDDLTRLVRLIARQAAEEALKSFKDALETHAAHAEAPTDSRIQPEDELLGTAGDADPPPEQRERWLSVAAVAERLDVSEKWVRRKIASRDLPAHRVGRLLRVSERGLADYVARTRLGRGAGRC